MALNTRFNAKNGLSVGIPAVNIFDTAGNATVTSLSSKGNAIVDTNVTIGGQLSAKGQGSLSGLNINSGSVDILKLSAASTRETILRAKISDSGNDAFHIFNATGVDGSFAPGFAGSRFSSNLFTMGFISQTNSANDNGTNPMMLFEARITDSQTDPNNGNFAAVSTRPLFGWQTTGSEKMRMLANGNLGIGDTSPAEKLTVSGNISASGVITALGGNSTIWNSTRSSVNTLSGKWESVYSTTNSNSGRWETTYTTVNTNSANWNPVGKYLPLSGGTLTGNLTGTSATFNGHLAATTKSFLIPHPTKEGKQLQYGVVESDQHSVFVRGKTNEKIITLPDYWVELVHEDSVTVHLTPFGKYQNLYVKSQNNSQIIVGGVKGYYNYTVYGERKDVNKLEVEI